MKTWREYKAAGFRVFRIAEAAGYVRVGTDPLDAEVKYSRYKNEHYFEIHHQTHRGKVLRCYIEKEADDARPD